MKKIVLDGKEWEFLQTRGSLRLPLTTPFKEGERVLIPNKAACASVEKRKTPHGISTHALFLTLVEDSAV